MINDMSIKIEKKRMTDGLFMQFHVGSVILEIQSLHWYESSMLEAEKAK